MDTQLAAKLAQYGAMGILLAVFVVLFIWMFRTLFTKFLQHLDVLTTTQKEIAINLSSLRQSIDDHNQETLRNHIEVLTHLTRNHA